MPGLLLSLVLALSTWTMGQDSVNAIVQRSVAANKRDYDAAPQFDCLEQNHKDGGSKTYEEMMVLGSPYERLVAVNGRRLSAAQQADEKRKLDNTISERQKGTSRQTSAARGEI
jgi:hypothetical protein